MKEPLVSVCIPAYNVGKYIAATIKSVVDQSYKNIEVIIVDDGSTDRALEIAKQYQNENIKIYSQPNKGASAARNKCLAMASGQFIQFLDGDDLLSGDKIFEQVNLLLKNPGAVAVCSTVHFKDGENHLQFIPAAYEDAFLINADPVHFLINLYGGFGDTGSMVQPNAWLTPRDVINKAGPWDETLTLDDDGEYFCRVLLNSKGVLKSNGYNYYRKYQQNENNLSALKSQQHLISQYQALKLKAANLQLYHSSKTLLKIQARWLHDLRFKAYPAYPGLVKQLSRDIAELNFDYVPRYPFPTLKGRILCKLFGWKIARRLQVFGHHLKSN